MTAIRTGRRAAAWLAAMLLATGAAWAVPLAAQEEDGRTRLVGRVTDSAGNPLAGAMVRLLRDGADDDGTARTARSQPSGGFQFVGVPAGRYRVRVEKDGFRPRERRVDVREGRVRTVVLRLRGAREARGPGGR